MSDIWDPHIIFWALPKGLDQFCSSTLCRTHSSGRLHSTARLSLAVIPWYWHLQNAGVFCNWAVLSPIVCHRLSLWCQASTSLPDPSCAETVCATMLWVEGFVHAKQAFCQLGHILSLKSNFKDIWPSLFCR